MPSRVTDQTHWCLSTPGLRWVRQPRKGLPRGKDSVDLIGSFGRRPSPVRDRRGRELDGSATGPGSFSWPMDGLRHNFRTKKIWSIRPRGTSAKNWSPDSIGAAVITFEWIAQGCTERVSGPPHGPALRESCGWKAASGSQGCRRPDGVPIGV